jgi:TolB protein
MKADGSDVTRLTNSTANNSHPAWSPDGTKIAFISFKDKTGYDIFVMNADGSDIEQVTDNNDFNMSPIWSPDGSQIAYSCWETDTIKRGRSFLILTTLQSEMVVVIYQGEDASAEFLNSGVCVVDADGSDMKKLTSSGSSNWSPDWSPDGELIAFSSDRGEKTSIYTMKPDGSDVTRLTDDEEGSDYTPSW